MDEPDRDVSNSKTHPAWATLILFTFFSWGLLGLGFGREVT